LSDNENATNSDCQLHVRLKLKLRLSRRNKEIGKVPVDFPRHLTAGDKRQMKQTLKSHSKQKGKKNTTPPVAKNYVQPTFITLFHFSFLCKGFQNVFLVRKPKCATCANFLQFFLAANFIGFHQEK